MRNFVYSLWAPNKYCKNTQDYVQKLKAALPVFRENFNISRFKIQTTNFNLTYITSNKNCYLIMKMKPKNCESIVVA